MPHRSSAPLRSLGLALCLIGLPVVVLSVRQRACRCQSGISRVLCKAVNLASGHVPVLKSSQKSLKSSFSSSLGSRPMSTFLTSAAHSANSACLLQQTHGQTQLAVRHQQQPGAHLYRSASLITPYLPNWSVTACSQRLCQLPAWWRSPSSTGTSHTRGSGSRLPCLRRLPLPSLSLCLSLRLRLLLELLRLGASSSDWLSELLGACGFAACSCWHTHCQLSDSQLWQQKQKRGEARSMKHVEAWKQEAAVAAKAR